jgi:hypothetical protein
MIQRDGSRYHADGTPRNAIGRSAKLHAPTYLTYIE